MVDMPWYQTKLFYWTVQLAGAVEYTDYISTEEYESPPLVSGIWY